MSIKYDKKGKNYRARKGNDHDDFFPTYHHLTRQYCSKEKFRKNAFILDPCAGAGDILKVLSEVGYKNIDGFDINPRAKKIFKLDFLEFDFTKDYRCDHIVTNPPFLIANQFIERASTITKKSMSFVLPLDYLHGMERYRDIYKDGINNFFLSKVYVLVRRPLFGGQYSAEGLMPTGAQTFAWYLFKKKNIIQRFFIKLFKLDPKIKWIDNSKFMGKHMMAGEQYLPGIK